MTPFILCTALCTFLLLILHTFFNRTLAPAAASIAKTLPGHTTYINRTCTTGDKGAHPTLPPTSPQPLSRSSKKEEERRHLHLQGLTTLSTRTIYKAHQGRKPPTDPSFPRHPPQGATSSAVNAANAKSYLFGDFATLQVSRIELALRSTGGNIVLLSLERSKWKSLQRFGNLGDSAGTSASHIGAKR